MTTFVGSLIFSTSRKLEIIKNNILLKNTIKCSI